MKPNGYRFTGIDDNDKVACDKIIVRSYLPKTHDNITITKDNIEVMVNDLCKINDYFLKKVKVVPFYANPGQEEFTILLTYKKKK
jgi:hypothetical protein